MQSGILNRCFRGQLFVFEHGTRGYEIVQTLRDEATYRSVATGRSYTARGEKSRARIMTFSDQQEFNAYKRRAQAGPSRRTSRGPRRR